MGTAIIAQNYVWDDDVPLGGTNYYKLVQVDLDGNQTGLSIKSVNFSLSAKEELKVYPNPINNGVLSASFPSAAGGATLSLLGIDGITLAIESVAPGTERSNMNVGRLSAGVYVLVYSSGKEMITSKVVIK